MLGGRNGDRRWKFDGEVELGRKWRPATGKASIPGEAGVGAGVGGVGEEAREACDLRVGFPPYTAMIGVALRRRRWRPSRERGTHRGGGDRTG